MRSGIDAQFGMVVESTFGTYAVPTRFLPFVSEDLKLNIDRDESKSLRTGQSYDRTDQWAAGKRTAGGTLEFEVGNKGFGLPLKHCAGTNASAARAPGSSTRSRRPTSTACRRRYQIGRPDTANTVQPFSYLGCKVTEFELSQKISDFLNLKMGIWAQDETTGSALAVATRRRRPRCTTGRCWR
jgi:hypothetical protein